VGEEIATERFEAADYVEFGRRLRAEIAAFGELLRRPGFGDGPPSVGAELELSLVDGRWAPAPVNAEVIRDVAGDGFALELDRFNVECDSGATPLAGRPFSRIAEDLRRRLDRLSVAAAAHGARPVMVGILPTLTPADLGPGALSDSPRFRALSAALRRLRDDPFHVRISGAEPLDVRWEDVSLEGAATAFHLHLRVPPERFADTFNAAQAAAAVALALAGNSPLLLGHLLWEETRVPLFHQAVDDRAEATAAWRPSRASFGHGWVQSGAAELFAQSAVLHAPILPIVKDGQDDPSAAVRRGEVPALDAMRLHGGTVWSWNRPVFDPGPDPHLRIELRSLPSGPTVADMAATSAFVVGLTLALAEDPGHLTAALPFDLARRNFYAAARVGLGATLLWPSREPPSPRPHAAPDLVAALLPAARRALVGAGVDAAEADEHLAIVDARARSGQTGAAWQRRSLARLERGMGRQEALRALLAAYQERAEGGAPVHTWTPAG
jgi:gamma-glutamyl:cysteine ligase YbdK (ATP-grasp superfamily)